MVLLCDLYSFKFQILIRNFLYNISVGVQQKNLTTLISISSSTPTHKYIRVFRDIPFDSRIIQYNLIRRILVLFLLSLLFQLIITLLRFFTSIIAKLSVLIRNCYLNHPLIRLRFPSSNEYPIRKKHSYACDYQ